MKDNVKQILKNVFLFIMIVFVVLIAYVAFIAGPKRAYEKEDRLYVEAMMKQEGYHEASILSRFSFDDIYYITKVKADGADKIVWFKKDLKEVIVDEFYPLDRIYPIADQLRIPHDKISYGVYKDELVYVLKGKKSETFFRVEDLQIVYHLGSEF
mgnify:CR=1 FL=1